MPGAPPIYRIVLTGGPCAGKSTALAVIGERLRASGFRVYRVPEASTMLLGGGARVTDATLEQLLSFQESILRVTLVQEDAFLAIAKSRDEPAVLLCDRGAMDGLAYLPDECWPRLLERAGVAAEDLQRRWYDAVVHLVTAAEGAEEQYHSLNNTTRYENVEQARNVDHRLRLAWRGPWRVDESEGARCCGCLPPWPRTIAWRRSVRCIPGRSGW